MTRWMVLLFFVVVLLPLFDAFKIEGKVVGHNRNANEGKDEVLLLLQADDGEQYQAFLRKDGVFIFDEVGAGSYLLQVLSTQYSFSNVRIDVSSRNNGQVRAFKAEPGSSSKEAAVLPYPLKLEPDRIMDYFMVREGFQIMSLLKNPMLIMLGVTLIMTLVLPKMMSSIDPEALQEMQGGATNAQQRELPLKWTAPALQL